MDTINDFKEKFFSDFDFSNQSKYLRKPKKEELADLIGKVDTEHAIRPYLSEEDQHKEAIVSALNGLHSIYLTIRYALDGVSPEEAPYKDGEKNDKYFKIIAMTLNKELGLTSDMAEALIDALQTNYHKS